jgi:hypothetical protein
MSKLRTFIEPQKAEEALCKRVVLSAVPIFLVLSARTIDEWRTG